MPTFTNHPRAHFVPTWLGWALFLTLNDQRLTVPTFYVIFDLSEGQRPFPELPGSVTNTGTAATSADWTPRFGLADVEPRELFNLALGGA